MKPSDVIRAGSFRTSIIASVAFAVTTLPVFGFLFWQTTGYESARLDRFLTTEAAALTREPAAAVASEVNNRYAGDLHRLTSAAVFTGERQFLSGQIIVYPVGLPVDGQPHQVNLIEPSRGQATTEQARAVARLLPDGRIVVVARSIEDLAKLRRVVRRALGLGLVPFILLALIAGTWASVRTLFRVNAINQAIARIMAGKLDDRLPVYGSRDALDQLSTGVNQMLDEIGRLISEVQGVGDDIAHDLRTPLTRARTRLEGGRNRAATREELVNVVDAAMADLDQTFGLITALLRIGQIESGQRRAGFRLVSLAAIAQEAGDLYLPIAELRSLNFTVVQQSGEQVYGDRDLLFELVANLLDNAVKFAPDGGEVRLVVRTAGGSPAIHVQDSGPGIPEAERSVVLRRFYRGDPSRKIAGSGLGLSIVSAILRLHQFRLVMGRADGLFTISVICDPEETSLSVANLRS